MRKHAVFDLLMTLWEKSVKTEVVELSNFGKKKNRGHNDERLRAQF